MVLAARRNTGAADGGDFALDPDQRRKLLAGFTGAGRANGQADRPKGTGRRLIGNELDRLDLPVRHETAEAILRRRAVFFADSAQRRHHRRNGCFDGVGVC